MVHTKNKDIKFFCKKTVVPNFFESKIACFDFLNITTITNVFLFILCKLYYPHEINLWLHLTNGNASFQTLLHAVNLTQIQIAGLLD